MFKKTCTKFNIYTFPWKGGPRIDEGLLLQRQIRDLGENQFKGNMAPLLQNLTKEIEFFERGDNKEDLHRLLNNYNSRRHPNLPYQVVNIIVILGLFVANIQINCISPIIKSGYAINILERHRYRQSKHEECS